MAYGSHWTKEAAFNSEQSLQAVNIWGWEEKLWCTLSNTGQQISTQEFLRKDLPLAGDAGAESLL